MMSASWSKVQKHIPALVSSSEAQTVPIPSLFPTLSSSHIYVWRMFHLTHMCRECDVTMLMIDYQLDEMERSLHDSLSVIKRTLESGSVVPGGGAVETALSIYLENFATSVGSREQLAIAEFATALLVIPKQLAVNAAKDSSDLIAKLRAYHASSQSATQGEEKKRKYRFYGLDLMEGKVRNNLE